MPNINIERYVVYEINENVFLLARWQLTRAPLIQFRLTIKRRANIFHSRAAIRAVISEDKIRF